jgi:hypothetical protein
MAILSFILGTFIGFAVGVYVMYNKVKELSTQNLDKLLINSLLKDSLKATNSKKPQKAKK